LYRDNQTGADAAGLLSRIAGLASGFLERLDERPVAARAGLDELRHALGGPLAEAGQPPLQVVEELARRAEPGLVATAGPRYFGFVIGGSLPAALGADWLTSAWDQNAGLFATSPAASVVEEIAAGWLLELLGLPASAGVGFVTGCQMANAVGLASARHAQLRRVGWDVERQGLQGAPRVNVVVGDEAHVTIFAALRLLGLGSESAVRVAADGQGRIVPEEMERALKRCEGPTIVCAQAGNVNTGASDPFAALVPLVRERGAWLHVDGAFGLWAAACPELRGQVEGLALADSWATDGHKWLNVPYDCGIAIVRDAAAQRAAFGAQASYLVQTGGVERDPFEWVPEFSRRARGFSVYAALRSLGRRGLVDMIERSTRHARRMAGRLAGAPGVRILNEVVLNQVLVRFEPPRGSDANAFTRRVITRVQREGTCWLGGTRWHGQDAMRVSIASWATTEDDIDRSAEAILSSARAEAEGA
jgi:glutamate/tyrosine decarboxylase-like PLP-dependent enzyme